MSKLLFYYTPFNYKLKKNNPQREGLESAGFQQS